MPHDDRRALWLTSKPARLAPFYVGANKQGVVITKNDLTTLIYNMRSLVKQWRSSIGEHGELVFYIDAC